MKKNLLATLLLFISSLTFSQTAPLVKQWDARFGGSYSDYFTSFVQSRDGGYLLGGLSLSRKSGDRTDDNWDTVSTPSSSDYWVVKTDSAGNKQWDKRFGGENDDQLRCVRQTREGGYILGGLSFSYNTGNKSETKKGNFDFWIVKIDAQGNKQWDKDFGATSVEDLRCVQQTADGGYILGGYSFSPAGGDKTEPRVGFLDYWIVRTDSMGNKLWDKTYGGLGEDRINYVQETADGGFILAGVSNSGINGDKTIDTIGGKDYWVIKINSVGTKLWQKVYGGINDEELFCIQQTHDLGFILGGTSFSGANGNKTAPSKGGSDYWIVKIDSVGNKQWDKSYGGTGDEDYFGALSITYDGGYLLSGSSFSSAGGDKTENKLGQRETWIVKINASGVKLWDKTILNTMQGINGMAIQTADRGIATANYTDSNTGGYKTQASQGFTDYWIVKFQDTSKAVLTLIQPGLSPNCTVQLYPNPATTLLNLTTNGLSGTYQLALYDMLGRQLKQEEIMLNGDENIRLDIAHLNKGAYIITLTNGRQVNSHQFIKTE